MFFTPLPKKNSILPKNENCGWQRAGLLIAIVWWRKVRDLVKDILEIKAGSYSFSDLCGTPSWQYVGLSDHWKSRQTYARYYTCDSRWSVHNVDAVWDLCHMTRSVSDQIISVLVDPKMGMVQNAARGKDVGEKDKRKKKESQSVVKRHCHKPQKPAFVSSWLK